MADDAIFSLMQEMGDQQYGRNAWDTKKPESRDTRKDADDSEKGTNPLRAKKRSLDTLQRLSSELAGYPNNHHMAGSCSIWNSMVQGMELRSSSSSSASSSQPSIWVILPTNPQVEVVRRRSFERFKMEMQELLQREAQNWEKLRQAQPGGGSGSSKRRFVLPVAQMIEKFHMDAKLQERHQRGKQVPANSSISAASTLEIFRKKTRLLSDRSGCYDAVLLSRQAPPLFVDQVVRPQVHKAWKTSMSSSSSSSSSLPPKFGKKAQQLQKATFKFVSEALDSFDKQLQRAAQQEATQSGSQRPPKIVHQSIDDDMLQVTFAGISFKLHSGYMEKLKVLFNREQHRRSISDREHHGGKSMTFTEALFCLLCRYDSIQGAGLQASVPGSVMDVLLQHFDCRLECFASPLNCRYDRFCSAFEDVDMAFGSYGSFFDIPDEEFLPIASDDMDNLPSCCFEANPPFCEELILQLNDKMNSILQRKSCGPVMFVVIVPAWKEASCYLALLGNPFLSHHLLLAQGKHYYAEGTQHRRKDSFRVASFDTSVLFFQNDTASKHWPLKDGHHDAVKALENAFEENPGNMEKQATKTQEKRLASLVSTASKSSVVSQKAGKTGGSGNNVSETHSQNVEKPNISDQSDKAKTKTASKDKKRLWSDQGESEAQLNLLHSLGIATVQHVVEGSAERNTKIRKVGKSKKRKAR